MTNEAATDETRDAYWRRFKRRVRRGGWASLAAKELFARFLEAHPHFAPKEVQDGTV